MAKRSALSSSILAGVGGRTALPSTPTPAEPAPAPPPSAVGGPKWREPQGSRRINFRVSEDTHRQLKILSAQLGRPMEDLVIEQLNRLFAEHDLPQIAAKPGR